MALRGTDPASHITEYTLVYEDNLCGNFHRAVTCVAICVECTPPCTTQGSDDVVFTEQVSYRWKRVAGVRALPENKSKASETRNARRKNSTAGRVT